MNTITHCKDPARHANKITKILNRFNSDLESRISGEHPSKIPKEVVIPPNISTIQTKVNIHVDTHTDTHPSNVQQSNNLNSENNAITNLNTSFHNRYILSKVELYKPIEKIIESQNKSTNTTDKKISYYTENLKRTYLNKFIRYLKNIDNILDIDVIGASQIDSVIIMTQKMESCLSDLVEDPTVNASYKYGDIAEVLGIQSEIIAMFYTMRNLLLHLNTEPDDTLELNGTNTEIAYRFFSSVGSVILLYVHRIKSMLINSGAVPINIQENKILNDLDKFRELISLNSSEENQTSESNENYKTLTLEKISIGYIDDESSINEYEDMTEYTEVRFQDSLRKVMSGNCSFRVFYKNKNVLKKLSEVRPQNQVVNKSLNSKEINNKIRDELVNNNIKKDNTNHFDSVKSDKSLKNNCENNILLTSTYIKMSSLFFSEDVKQIGFRKTTLEKENIQGQELKLEVVESKPEVVESKPEVVESKIGTVMNTLPISTLDDQSVDIKFYYIRNKTKLFILVEGVL